jgi:hypothetical protein
MSLSWLEVPMVIVLPVAPACRTSLLASATSWVSTGELSVPLSPPVERHEQQVRPGQLGQDRAGPGQLEHLLAQRPAYLLQHRGLGQEHPLPAGDPGQELRLHVLTHQPVIPAEGNRGPPDRAALPQVQRRQVQPGRPALGPLVQLGYLGIVQRHAGVAQQRCRLLTGQRQILRADLGDPALRAQPRDLQRRPSPAGQDQLRTTYGIRPRLHG